MWETIQDLVRGGSTVLLTTQYMEEADRLADDIVVIDQGRKIAQGTANELKAQIGGERVEVILSDAGDIPAARSVLEGLSVGEVQVDEQTRRLTAPVSGGVDVLKQVLERFEDQRVDIVDVGPGARPWTTSSCRSPAMPPRRPRRRTESGRPKRRRADAREKEAVR